KMRSAANIKQFTAYRGMSSRQELGSMGTSSEPMVKTAARRRVTRMPPITRPACDRCLGVVGGGVMGWPQMLGAETVARRRIRKGERGRGRSVYRYEQSGHET